MRGNKREDELSVELLTGPVPFDDFVTAARRAVAILGRDAALDRESADTIGSELYAMALEEPEWEVFS